MHPLFNSLVREPIFQIQRGIPSSQPGIPNSLSSGSFTLEAAKNCNFFTKAFLSSKIRSKFDMLRLKIVRTWKNDVPGSNLDFDSLLDLPLPSLTLQGTSRVDFQRIQEHRPTASSHVVLKWTKARNPSSLSHHLGILELWK